MKRHFFALIAVAIASLLLNNRPVKAQDIIAPDFTLQDLNREAVFLSNYRDKQAVILFFWTTWCPYCRKELQVLQEKYREIAKEGGEVLAINVRESSQKVNNFIRKNALTLKVLLDEDAAVASDYPVLGFPTYVLIDKKGRIRSVGFSFPEEYREIIQELNEN